MNWLLKCSNKTPTSRESSTPAAPPSRQTNTASIKNCCSMSPVLAPTAIRTPISRVRSLTDTSMMFITPMPPTIREMSAIMAIKRVRVALVLVIAWRMLSVLSTKKS